MSKIISLKEKYKDYFLVGAAVNKRTVNTHVDLIKEHFSSITCENETKYRSVVKQDATKEDMLSFNNERIYDFTEADKIYNFAKENGLSFRGHTFVWHNQAPEFIFENSNKEELLSIMKHHISVIGNRYKDYIFCWDVVNEAIEDKSEEVYRKSKWFNIIGSDFIDYAFNYAKEIVPEAKLYYNDYNEIQPIKRDKIYNLINSMKERGIPIDGVGLQGHWNIERPSFDDIKRAFEVYASLGLKIQITEMDISLYTSDADKQMQKPSQDVLEKQAIMYQKAFEIFREYREYVECVTLWGVADDENWLDNFPVKNRKNWPLLFDESHKPKEAFYRITDF